MRGVSPSPGRRSSQMSRREGSRPPAWLLGCLGEGLVSAAAELSPSGLWWLRVQDTAIAC
eukprot:12893017-Prorocentrum_lima.AAC.1